MAAQEVFSSSDIKSNLFGDSKIADKVKKLLALSKSDNEHEAMLALQRAQELIAKHNLEMGEVNDEAVIEDVILGEKTTGLSRSRSLIANVMADQFQVMVFIDTIKGNKRLKVIGRTDDVKVFVDSFNWTYNVYNQLFKKFLKLKNTSSRGESLRIKNDYLQGFCLGLRDKLVENVSCKSLMIYVPEAVQTYVEKNYHLVNRRSSRLKSNGDMDAFMQGREDGRNSQGMKNALN